MSEPIELTRVEARKQVADLQGWTVTNDGSFTEMHVLRNPKGHAHMKEYSVARAWDMVPDCFDMGNAVALLWELPKDYISQSPSQHNLSMRLLWLDPDDEKSFGQDRGSWLTKTPDAFAVACVSAYLTAHLKTRVTIED